MQDTTEIGSSHRPPAHHLLEEQSWEDIFMMLTAFAQMLINEHAWRGEWGGSVPGGREAADFAAEAILDVHTGVRAWDPERYPDLRVHLRWVVRSKISNAVELKENKDILWPEEEQGTSADPDETFFWGFFDYLKDDPLLQRAVECIFDGYDDRAGLAERLGLDVNEVTNLKKRLQRRLADFQRLESDRM